ncbi:MAG: PaaI family thioesterase [Myxococcales bacterium]
MADDGLKIEGTMMEALGMEFVEYRPDRVVVRMPVGPKVHQPFGLLHGGASVALAETAASFGTGLNVDLTTHSPVGSEITASHVRPVKDGFVVATATVLHKGRTSMVWHIRVETEAERKLVCVSQCRVSIVPNRP